MKRNNKTMLDAASLYLLYLVNGVFPLALIPIYTRALGVDGYGVVAFHQAIAVIFMAVVDFSFNFTATRELAKIKVDAFKVSAVFSKYMSAKIILLLAVLPLYFICIVFVGDDFVIGLCFVLQLVGTVLFPIWYFQAIGKIQYIALVHVVSKILILVVVFALVNGREDLYLAAFALSSSYLISGLLSILLIYFTGDRPDYIFNFNGGFSVIRSSSNMFIGIFSNVLYMNLGVVLLGALGHDSAVGVFSAGAKLRNGLQMVVQPLNQIYFPKVSSLSVTGKNKAEMAVRLIKWQLLMLIILSLVFLLVSKEIAIFFTNDDQIYSQILIMLCIIGGCVQAYKQSVMQLFLSAFGYDAEYRDVAFMVNAFFIGVAVCFAFVICDSVVLSLFYAALYVLVDLAAVLYTRWMFKRWGHSSH